jgi:RNA polymerase sigma factor (sigma-70 family)
VTVPPHRPPLPGSGTITETSLTSTATLVQRLQDGDEQARDELVARCLPPLRRWAHGRLPAYARDLADTDDLVQTTLLRTVARLPSLAPGESGSFLAYMRQVLVNEVRDQVRRHQRRPPVVPLPEHDRPGDRALQGRPADPAFLAAYERALAALTLPQRDAVVLRVELGMTFPEIALELALPSADAARMRVARGLADLAEAMPR